MYPAARVICVLATVLPGPDKGTPVDYTVHTGYFEKNDSGLKDRVSYLAITGREVFDKLFGAAYTMGKAPKVLPANAFDSRMVIAVVKRGSEVWQYEVQGMVAIGNTLILRYEAWSKGGAGARFASPLVISLPKGPYRSVAFIENGKEVGTAPVHVSEAP